MKRGAVTAAKQNANQNESNFRKLDSNGFEFDARCRI